MTAFAHRHAVVVVGLGRVGRAVIAALRGASGLHFRAAGETFSIVGLVDSRGAVLDEEGLSTEKVDEILALKERGGTAAEIGVSESVSGIVPSLPATSLVVDATSSHALAPSWKSALDRGCGVVLANKLPLCGAWSAAKSLFEHPRLRHEATIGAGLPIVSTARKLLATGAGVHAAEGVLSGTLSSITAAIAGGEPLSEALEKAQSLGYSEHDPLEDLTGRDVSRKALILARTRGWPLEPSDVETEPLVDPSLTSFDALAASLPRLDRELADRFRKARAEGMTLRYIARLTPRGATASLCPVVPDSLHGTLRGPSYLVAFHSEIYKAPVVLIGPGSGPRRAAAGVLTDLLDLAGAVH
ncbi:MAG: hypothetical protein JSW65_03250 [Candidatus Bipolaricaulota bacterium]|nr:MAG: hypothetical protein JSW65_03250 [Candidatus Bipolaricaulota bacterium]